MWSRNRIYRLGKYPRLLWIKKPLFIFDLRHFYIYCLRCVATRVFSLCLLHADAFSKELPWFGSTNVIILKINGTTSSKRTLKMRVATQIYECVFYFTMNSWRDYIVCNKQGNLLKMQYGMYVPMYVATLL